MYPGLVPFPPKSWGLFTKGCSCSLPTAARLGDFLDGNFTLAGVFFISHVNPFIKCSSEDSAISTEHWSSGEDKGCREAKHSHQLLWMKVSQLWTHLLWLCWQQDSLQNDVEMDDFPGISETCLEQLVQMPWESFGLISHVKKKKRNENIPLGGLLCN